jgi:hypothetical protein
LPPFYRNIDIALKGAHTRWAGDRRFMKENPKTTASGKEEDHSERGRRQNGAAHPYGLV